MRTPRMRTAVTAVLAMALIAATAHAEKKVVKPRPGSPGEWRAIDLKGVGTRSIRRIDFWYDTKGFLKGKADVTVFGMK